MSHLTLAQHILPVTYDALRSCGRLKAECVVYWTGPLEQEAVVDGVEHPVHTAGRGWYEVDQGWLTTFFARLRHDKRAVRAQVHTHPGRAGHSETDDLYSIVPVTGFLSLVIPSFARGKPSLRRTYLAELQADGSWRQVESAEMLQLAC